MQRPKNFGTPAAAAWAEAPEDENRGSHSTLEVDRRVKSPLKGPVLQDGVWRTSLPSSQGGHTQEAGAFLHLLSPTEKHKFFLFICKLKSRDTNRGRHTEGALSTTYSPNAHKSIGWSCSPTWMARTHILESLSVIICFLIYGCALRESGIRSRARP